VVIINALGQKLNQSGYQAQPGQQTFIIPVKQYSSGIYYVQVLVNGKAEKSKSIVKE